MLKDAGQFQRLLYSVYRLLDPLHVNSINPLITLAITTSDRNDRCIKAFSVHRDHRDTLNQ